MGSSGKHEKFMRRCIQLVRQAKAQGNFNVINFIYIRVKFEDPYLQSYIKTGINL